MELQPDELFDELFKDCENQSIIYIGVGTHYNNDNELNNWNFNLNQELPIFLHDFKLNYPSVPIKIILFDKATTVPYIVTNTDSFYSESFICDSKYSNVYNSTYGIKVYNFSINVDWNNNIYDAINDTYNITNLLFKIVSKVSNSNNLLFFHEFTGRNPAYLENEIKKMIDYDNTKICIDISRGQDLSCSVDFANPENYPLIKFDNHNITWINPFNIPYEKQYEITKIYINEKVDINKCPYNDEFTFNYFLFKQIINKNQEIYNYCKSLMYWFRTFRDKDLKELFVNFVNIKFKLLDAKMTFLTEISNKIISNLLMIRDLLNKDSMNDTMILYKNDTITLLKEYIIKALTFINPLIIREEFNQLFLSFDTVEDKYKILPIFNNFCLKHNINQ